MIPRAAGRRRSALLPATALLGLVALGGSTAAHEVPSFPRVTVLAARADPLHSLRWTYTVEVRDPAGRRPLADAEVRVTGFERRQGSGVRLGAFWLAQAPTPGIYQGTVEFPQPGVWELTITVRGAFIGETHRTVEVGATPARVESPLDRPDLAVDWRLARHLLLEWGHLAGFGLWLGATAGALFAKRPSLKAAVVLTWVALALAGGTGFYKLEVGTPFARGLSFGWPEIPRVFFGREYVYTLALKHGLIVAAIAVTGVLTWHAWRPSERPERRVRALLAANLALALAIAACAAVLGMLHAIVLHFS